MTTTSVQICKKEEFKCISIVKQYELWLTMMILQKKTKRIPDHPYRSLSVGGSGYGKTNTLLSNKTARW